MTTSISPLPATQLLGHSPRQLSGRGTLLRSLLTLYVICLPVQIPTSERSLRFAPADVFLILYVLLAAGSSRIFRLKIWSGWHVAVLLSFAMATLIAVMKTGRLSRYVLLNKDIGVLILFVAYAILASEATNWYDMRRLLRTFIWAVAVNNTLALISFFGLAPWLPEHHLFEVIFTGRLSGMLIDPNAYGGLLVVTFAIQAMTYFSSKPIVGGALGLYIIFSMLTGVLYTYSRSAWISVTVVLLVLCVVRPWLALSFVMIIGLGIAAIGLLANSAYVNNMVYMSERPEQVDSRIDIISHALPRFLESPICGVGLSVFADDYGIIIHNTPVWFLTEFGLIGFVCFIGLYTWIMLCGLRAYRWVPTEEKPLVLGFLLAHMAVLGLSMGIEAFYQRHWWLTMAMIAASGALACRRLDRFGALQPAQRQV